MREGWTYKTIEDACSINYGTRVVQKKDKGSTYYVYGGGGATFMIDRYNREDCFIVSRFAMSPKCTRYVEGKFFLNDSGLSVSTNDEGFLCQKFLDKVLLANNDNIYAMGKGMAQRNLDMPSFRKLIIPIPPIEEQERIVAELDLLSGIIEKKKEQLKAYDQLAQSIFYTMFGDPIDNPKGWETDILENVVSTDCCISYGIVQPGNEIENGIPVVRPVDLVNQIVTRKGLKQIEKRISDDYKRTILKGGELLFCVRGTTGVMSFASDDLKGCNVTRGITPLSFNESINKYYAFYYLKTDGLQAMIADNTRGIALKQINMKDVRALPFPVPPLSLQEEFAEKVEAIERQKALVQQSIEETQTMFDYTMDKYFG